MSGLERDDIQGLVLRAYGRGHTRYLFAEVTDPIAARQWIAQAAPTVRGGAVRTAGSARTGSAKEPAVNLGFSAAGLIALGLDPADSAGFPPEFRGGMKAAAERLGDRGESAVDAWQHRFRERPLHVLVLLWAPTESALGSLSEQVAESLGRLGGLAVVATEDGRSLPGDAEHFGFRDGLSQPVVDGAGLPDDRSRRARPTEPPLKAGEFVLGYPDAEGVRAGAALPAWLARNGSYLVYRKLRQDVAGFRALTEATAALYPSVDGGAEEVAARLVGRWRDGRPLAGPHGGPGSADDNGFGFAHDPSGTGCPLGAHIRRVNPRDGLAAGPDFVRRHRMMRRGTPYGEPLPAGRGDDGADRGLHFVCVVGDIGRQFEFVQAQWMAGGNGFRLGDEPDVMAGMPGGCTITLQGDPPRFVHPVGELVRTLGGEYFFLPGRQAIGAISRLGGPTRASA